MVRHDRQELPAPPYVAITWTVLFCYIAVGLEGAFVALQHPWLGDLSFNMVKTVEDENRVRIAQIHICLVYVLEVLLAVGPRWCAMSPGWTCGELMQHHVPYVVAVGFAIRGGHLHRWTSAMTCVLLTPANEGLFIVGALGAPKSVEKLRRLIGFLGIFALCSVESWTLLRNQINHWHQGSDAIALALADLIPLVGIAYHLMLLRMYLGRWRKTRCL